MQELISSFDFDNLKVRTFVDEQGRPWFCATDVCKALGYAVPQKTTRDHCKPEGVTKRNTLTSKGLQALSYINERNLYRLIMRSKLESAERFQDWVEGEVLPAIRKTGTYGAAATLPDYPTTLRLYAEQLEKNMALAQQVEAAAPKVDFVDRFVTTQDTYLFREVANALHIGEHAFIDWLHGQEAIYRLNGRWKIAKWALDQKLFAEVFKNVIHPKTHKTFSYIQPYVTTKGAYWAHKRMLAAHMAVPDQMDLSFAGSQ